MTVVSTDGQVNKYFEERSALIAKDRALRTEHTEWDSLSEKERKADAKIKALRDWEVQNLWAPKDQDDMFPGMGFLTAKNVIDKSKLFSLLKKMPKGALLHCHFDATVDIKTLMQLALARPNIFIRIPTPFPSHSFDVFKCHTSILPLPEFATMKKSEVPAAESIVDSYSSKSWVPMHLARSSFPFGGPEGFDQWVYKTMTIDPVEAYETHSSVTKIWEKFETTFGVCDGLIRNEPVFREYVKHSLRTAIDDGISYIEYRILFYFKTMFNAEGEDVLDHKEWLKIFQESMLEVQQQLDADGRRDSFAGAKVSLLQPHNAEFKIIYTTMRDISHEEMWWYMEDCLALKQAFPGLIAGFDIVGPENKGHPLKFYVEDFHRFQRRQKELDLDVPLILHAGETLGDGDEVDSNVYDAILLGTKRIGHGFSLVKHPHLMQLCRERNIALEVCPISNEVLRLTPTMALHPLLVLLNHGVPITLNSDDPAIWTSSGVSYDYYQVLISSNIVGLVTLAQIAKRGLQVSCLAEKDKVRALEIWQHQFDSFVDEILAVDIN